MFNKWIFLMDTKKIYTCVLYLNYLKWWIQTLLNIYEYLLVCNFYSWLIFKKYIVFILAIIDYYTNSFNFKLWIFLVMQTLTIQMCV